MTQQKNKRTKTGNLPNIEYEEDLDQIDFNNYKGMFFDDQAQKYQDPNTGAHFDYHDMCCRLIKLQKKLNQSQHEAIQDHQENNTRPKEENPLGQLKQLLERKKQKESRNAAQKEYGTMKVFQDNNYIISNDYSNKRHNEGNVRSKSTDKGPQSITFYNAGKKIMNPKAHEVNTQKDKKKQSLLELYL